ncbi:MAG: T9SS type A sorting domain-containing protein, partial [Bacteroidota bacterium]
LELFPPSSNCDKECKLYEEVREITVRYVDVEQRAAYSLEEFLDTFVGTADELSHQMGNSECITGVYAQWAAGTIVNDDGEFELFVVISHPFNEKEATPTRGRFSWKEMTEKGNILEDVLRDMCYSIIDGGWLSIANWNKLDPNVQGKAIRLTNRNFGGRNAGRVTGGGEYLWRPEGDNHILLGNKAFQQTINQRGLEVSDLIGPNFPTPGYDSGPGYDLFRMPDGQWLMDAQEGAELTYLQDFEARKDYQIILDPVDNVIRNSREELVDIFGDERGSYVMDCMGNIFLSTTKDPELDFIKHSQVLGGAAVAAAGELYVDQGFITYAHNGRDIYSPDPLAFETFKLQFPEILFEEPYENPLFGYDQSWACETIELRAPIQSGASDLFNPVQNQYVRRWTLPERIPTTSAVPPGGLLKITATIITQREVFDQVFTYNVEIDAPSAFSFVEGESFFEPSPEPGDTIYFNKLEMTITNMPLPDIGDVVLTIDNCNPECLPLDRVQNLRVTFNGVETRYAYTLDEFLRNGLNSFPDQQFEPPFDRRTVANTECVQGAYSRYFLGYNQQLDAKGEYPYMMLISHPYSQADAAQSGELGKGEILDKARDFAKTLEEMCYRPVEDGWISLANWGLVDPDIVATALRFTNSTWGSSGRIVPRSERLGRPSWTFNFLENSETKRIIGAVNISISDINGPNFPTPGYSEPVYSTLTAPSNESWADNTQNARIYIQETNVRQLFTANESLDGLLVNSSQRPIGAQATKRFRYAMDCMGNIFHTNHTAPNATVQFPSQFLGGGAVAAAGEIIVDNGNLRYMNTNAIHYTPPRSSLEALDATLLLMDFESPYQTTPAPIYQAWECATLNLQAPINGSAIGLSPFEEGLPLQRFQIPGRIRLSSGVASGELKVKSIIRQPGILSGELIPFVVETLTYVPDERRTGYIFSQAEKTPDFIAGDNLFYEQLEISVVNGNTTGTVALSYNNCEANRAANVAQPDVITSSEVYGLEESVFPNPATDVVNLRIAVEDAVLLQSIVFFDLDGKRFAPSWSVHKGFVSIDTSLLFNGIYTIRAISKQHIWETKLVIMK